MPGVAKREFLIVVASPELKLRRPNLGRVAGFDFLPVIAAPGKVLVKSSQQRRAEQDCGRKILRGGAMVSPTPCSWILRLSYDPGPARAGPERRSSAHFILGNTIPCCD